MNGDAFKAFLEGNGYFNVRQLSTGEWAGIQQFMFTFGLMVGLDRYGYRTRYCYGNLVEAVAALDAWDGKGSPPGNWIVEKGRDGERQNPNREIVVPFPRAKAG